MDILLIKAEVLEYSEYETGDAVTVRGRAESVKATEYGVNIYLDSGFWVSCQDKECEVSVGDTIEAKGTVRELQEARNDGQFDQKMYYRSIGIFYRISSKNVQVISRANGYMSFVNSVKKRLEESFDKIADEQDGGVLKAIVLGDKASLDKDYYSLYQRNGIAHLLAISGLHISFVGLALYKLLRKSGVKCIMAFAAASVFLAFYGTLTGNGVSARRAIIMCVVSMGAEVVGKMYDTLSSLSLAAILLICENPYSIFNSAFLLSFSAILGICLVAAPITGKLAPRLKKWRKRVYFDTPGIVIFGKKAASWLLLSLISSAGISLFTLPVILYSYFEVPVFGVFLNIIVIPLMSVVLFAGIAGGVIAVASPAVGTFFIGSVHYILKLYQFLCSITDKIPFNRVCLGRPLIWQIVLYYILLMVVVRLATNVKKYRRYSPAIAAAALAVIAFRRTYEFQAHMIDVGQGDGVYVSTGGLNMLFDGGSSDISSVGTYRIYTFLKSHGVSSLDYVFVSHTDKDHISGINELIEMNGSGFRIKTLVMPYYSSSSKEENYINLVNAATNQGIRILYASAGKMQLESDDFSLKCISPFKSVTYSDINASSAVYLLKYKDFSMLLTGDMTSESEKIILNDEKLFSEGDLSRIDCLKVAHHGSKTSSSSEFIKRISPKLAFISCGIDNSYGHPNEETLNTLADAGSLIYETDKCGQISLYYEKSKVSVRVKISG